MGFSIQEILKKINSRLSFYDCLSVGLVFIAIIGLYVYISREKQKSLPLSYIVSTESITSAESKDSRPFASKKGKTYTYSWCSGSSNIALKNKIYFNSEEGALASGRRLSKLCTK